MALLLPEMLKALPDGRSELLSGAIWGPGTFVVNIQQGVDAYLEDVGEAFDPLNGGSIRPPAPVVWMEWMGPSLRPEDQSQSVIPQVARGAYMAAISPTPELIKELGTPHGSVVWHHLIQCFGAELSGGEAGTFSLLADPLGNHIAQIGKDGRAGVRMVPQGGLWAIVGDESDPVRTITESFLHNWVNPIIHSLQIYNSPWSVLDGAPSTKAVLHGDERCEEWRSLGTYRLLVPARPIRYLPAVPDVSLVPVRPKVRRSRRKAGPKRSTAPQRTQV